MRPALEKLTATREQSQHVRASLAGPGPRASGLGPRASGRRLAAFCTARLCSVFFEEVPWRTDGGKINYGVFGLKMVFRVEGLAVKSTSLCYFWRSKACVVRHFLAEGCAAALLSLRTATDCCPCLSYAAGELEACLEDSSPIRGKSSSVVKVPYLRCHNSIQARLV